MHSYLFNAIFRFWDGTDVKIINEYEPRFTVSVNGSCVGIGVTVRLVC